MRKEGARGRFDQVARAGSVNSAAVVPARSARITGEQPRVPGKKRRQMGDTSTPLPMRAWLDRIRTPSPVRFYARAVKEI